MSHIDVMKQALEYLQDNQHLIADNERHAYVMEYNAFIERFEQVIAEAEKQQALDKMADNERELGIQMQPPVPWSQELESVWAEPEEQPAPAQQDIPDLIAGALGVSRGTAYDLMREALADQPAQQEPVADKHQAFIDSLPSDMEDKMFEQIHYWARQSYARHQRSTRGQTITAADSSDNHIIWAALRWAKENAATPQAQPAQQEPVALDVIIKGDAAKLLAAMLEPVLDDEPTPIRLLVGNGHSGHGLYVAAAEYQEEGAALLVNTPQAPAQPLTDKQIEREWQFLHDEEGNPPDHHDFARAIEAAHGITKGGGV